MRVQANFIKIVSGFMLVFISMPALAIVSMPNGWYLEGNAGASHLSNTNTPGSTSSSGVGYNLNVGYKFMPYLGLEMGYTRYADSKISSGGSRVASDTHYSYGIFAKGILPIENTGVEGFAKFGVQRIYSHISVQNATLANSIDLANRRSSATGLFYGVGGQYYFTPEFAAVVQWERAQGNSNTGNQDLLSAGLSFIFS